jgi:sulfite exporter TauE/SafE
VTLVLAGLLLGVAGSLHCVMMCGPLIMLTTGGPELAGARWSTLTRRLTRAIWHHGGRILMYGAVGLAAGGAGHLLADAGLRAWVSIGAGIGLTANALVSFFGGRVMPGRGRWTIVVTRAIGRASQTLRRDRPWNRLALGLLNGLLPCGLLYGALLAATGLGRALPAGAFMLAFGLGSVPALTTMAVALSGADRSRALWRRLSPAATGIVGLLLIVRGLGLPGLHVVHTHVMK